MTRKLVLLTMSGALIMLTGCGKSTGNVTLQQKPYSSTAALATVAATGVQAANFSFCVTKVQLRNAEGKIEKKDDKSSIEARLGLINASEAGASGKWGEVELPVDFELGEIKLEVHKDAERCSGADYSVQYNSVRLEKDLEFKFTFNPAVKIEGGDTVKLDLSPIAHALSDAAAAGRLNNEQISEYLTPSTVGFGSK